HPDTRVGATQGQAQLAIEPGRYRLQVAKRPEAEAGDRHQGPQQVVDIDVVRCEVDGSQAEREQWDGGQYHAPGSETVDEHTLQGRDDHNHVRDDRKGEGDIRAEPAELL